MSITRAIAAEAAVDLVAKPHARNVALRRLAEALAAWLALLLIFAGPSAAGAPDRDLASRTHLAAASRPAAPDRVIVKFKKSAGPAARAAAIAGVKAQARKSLRLSRAELLEIRDSRKRVEDVVKELEASGLVEYAEPDYVVEALDTYPSDPYFSSLWGLSAVDAPSAWDLSTGEASKVVMVIDTGVDYAHEDLLPNLWINPGEIPGNGIDDDGNGYVDDVHGINAITGSGDPLDDHDHGTHVAGTIGAAANNGVGVVGLAWHVQIMACKFLSASGSGYHSDAIECLEYATRMKQQHGVDLVLTSNSWGGGGYSEALRDAIAATGHAGMLFVAAAGNSANDNDVVPAYPASFDLGNIVAVGATDSSDARASFSNFGATTVDLFAPGQGILSSVTGDRYAVFSGTSMATPHVSGAAALVWSYAPEADPAGVKRLLMSAVDRFHGLTSVSGGRLNIGRALALCEAGNPSLSIGVADGASFRQGREVAVPIELARCTSAITGAHVTVTPGGGPALTAYDDGIEPDAEAEDGVYTALWTAEALGTVPLGVEVHLEGLTLSDSVTVEVVRDHSYAVVPAPFAWVDATAGTRLTSLACDDCSAELAIGFEFSLYGQRHQRLQVSSNGYLTFGAMGWSYSNGPLPSPSEPNALIAPYWDDLYPGTGGGVYALLEGQAPNRRLTVAWVGVPYFGQGASTTFEVTLYEDGSRMVFQYLDVSAGAPAFGASATVGIEDARGSSALQYSYNQSVLSNGDAFMIAEQVACDDADLDGVCDDEDNCLVKENTSQTDTDQDGFGNACDPDFNQDGLVGSFDFNFLRRAFGAREGESSYDPVADCDGDGAIGGREFDLMKRSVGGQPGPSGLECAGVAPCSAR
jgi:subtilisin family serine protease